MQHPAAGFTLVELVLVVVLVGTLSAVALPRLNLEGFDRQRSELILVNALREGQKLARASGCHVSVTVSGGSFSVSYSGAGASVCTAQAVPHPSRSGNFDGALTGVTGGGGTVTFDGFGHADSALQVDFSDGRTVAVEAETGYVALL